MDLIGKPVRKKFPKFGLFKGVIDSYDSESGFYKILYEDGDCEDVDLQEVQSLLIETTEEETTVVSDQNPAENADSDPNPDQNPKTPAKKGRKKRRISELGSETPVIETTVSENTVTPTPVRRSARQASNAAKAALYTFTPDLTNTEKNQKKNKNKSKNLDSVSCENSKKGRGRKKISEIEDLGPKFELPPSSKTLDLEGLNPLDFFMVYSSLRSFSRQFFLSPFKLETFLSALKCNFTNSLIDSVHFSLLHALKKHLEVLSEQGSQSAAHCIRNLNWDLLDHFTWPVFLAEYLLVHSSELKPTINLPNLNLLSSEYYTQPAEIKLEILRCLCDDVMQVELIHNEIDLRSGESDPNGEFSNRPKKRGRKPKYVKKEEELVQALNAGPGLDGEEEGDDKNIDECFLCTMDGNLLCCDGCPLAFHSRCVGVAKDLLPEGVWYCPECAVGTGDKSEITKRPLKDVRGGEMLGIDPNGRVYFWSCDYLLVSDSYETADSCYYYSKSDIISVLNLLNSCPSTYRTIIDAICSCSSVSLESSPCNEAEDIQMSPKKEISHFSPSKDDNSTKTLDEINPSKDENCTKTLEEINLSIPISPQIELQNADIINSEVEKLFITPNWGKNGALVTCDKDSDLSRYINSYSFGRLAFSICLEFLHVLAENREQKKPIEDYSALQLKAISDIAPTFCWNSYQKFPIELQTESCGWCFPCRASETQSYTSLCVFKAAFNEKQIENLDNKASLISSALHHILSVEERLRGLLSGPWENPNYSETWRNEVSMALDVKSLSKLFLQLESHLRRNALTPDWTRPVDSSPVVGSAVHISIRPAHISVRKRGRPRRKSSARTGSTYTDSSKPLAPTKTDSSKPLWSTKTDSSKPLWSTKTDSSKPLWSTKTDSTKPLGSTKTESTKPPGSTKTECSKGVGSTKTECSKGVGCGRSKKESNVGINWWRGGKMSREVFGWKRLPRALALKAGRQGGLKKIPTVVYPEGSDIIARRIKCVAWRASLEMSESVSQLIFQVKEFESYIKWAEIGSSMPFSPVTKESKRLVKQFKKVIVWRKITEGPVTKYLLDFGKTDKGRLIPPIVVKYGTKVEEPNNERIKYWLAENYVPLHLLNHFEEKKFIRQMKKKKDGSTPVPSEKSKKKKKDGSTPAPSEKSKKKKKKNDGSTPVAPSEKSKKEKKKDGSTPAAPSEKPKRKKNDGSTPAGPSEKSKELTESKSKKRVKPSDDLGLESSAKKQRRVFGFDHLFEKAEKSSQTQKCGRCDKDVVVSEAVNCQSCEGIFHRKHFKLPKDISAILFICIKCKDQSAKKPQPMKSPKKEESESNSKPKPKASKKKKKQKFNLKKKLELVVRRSDRLSAKKPQPKKKSKKKYKKKPKKSEPKITNLIPENLCETETELTWPKRKRTVSPHSYWLNGLHWTHKLNDELNINFIRSKIILPTENIEISQASRPVCSICVKEYNSQSLYISCDNCEEWFHGDVYEVKAENLNMIIGFKCHKCRKRNIPLCPHTENSQSEPTKVVPQEQNKLSGTSVLAPCSNKGKTGDYMNIDEKPNDWNADFVYVVPQEDIIQAIFGEEKEENSMEIDPPNGISQMDQAQQENGEPNKENEENSMEIDRSNGISQMDLAQQGNGEPRKKNNGFVGDLCMDKSNEKLNGEGERKRGERE